MRQRSLDEMITYFNQEIDKMDIDRRYKIALLGMVTAIGCTAKQTIDERKKGKWTREVLGSTSGYGTTTMYQCSVCECMEIEQYNYCPTCGARMRGGEK